MKNPLLDYSPSDRMYRGGSWNNYAMDIRAPLRYYFAPSPHYYLGFRLFRTLEKS